MVRKFARGDRVKLTDLMVRTIMRGVAMPRKRNDRYVNWEGRFGEVISASSTNVVILWDGRKTYDQWPPGALEKSRSGIDTLGGDQRDEEQASLSNAAPRDLARERETVLRTNGGGVHGVRATSLADLLLTEADVQRLRP
jgi:hypothetical protein